MLDDFTLLDLVGIAGSLIICAAYLAVSLKRVDPEGIPFQASNGSGAILLLISLWYRPNPGAIVIGVLWLAIAAFAIGRALFRRR